MDLTELGRRAVACKYWRWMPGMAVLGGFAGADRLFADKWGMIHAPDEDAGMLPDLSDPATLGCLLYLVREATGQQSSPSWYPGGKHDYPHWAWYSDNCYGKLCEGATEAECLVRVLEFTP